MCLEISQAENVIHSLPGDVRTDSVGRSHRICDKVHNPISYFCITKTHAEHIGCEQVTRTSLRLIITRGTIPIKISNFIF
jgi:hypothetical protein